MGQKVEIEGYHEVLREMEHDELIKAVSKVATAVSSLPKEDPELKELMSQNRDAINNFVKAVEGLKNQEKPEVKVETNQDKVVDAVTRVSTQIAEIMKGIDQRLTSLESQPKPQRLKVKRNGWDKSIEEITIEYNK